MNAIEIKDLMEYNLWANNRLLEAAAQLTGDQYLKDVQASHGGIHGTLTHIIGAQKVWLERWMGVSVQPVLKGSDVYSLLDLVSQWEKIASETAHFLNGFTDEKLQDTITITTSTGQTFTHTFQQMIQHLVNHSSTHRGQVVAMMRQNGIKPPTIDLIQYYRQK